MPLKLDAIVDVNFNCIQKDASSTHVYVLIDTITKSEIDS